MRTTLTLACLSMLAGGLVGCTPVEPDTYVYRSTFDHETRGIVLHNSGEDGHAGMYGTNCPYETNRGSVTGDYNLPDSDEELQDHGVSALGPNTIVAVIGETVWTLDKTTGSYVLDSIEVPGVDRARIVDSGIVSTVDTGSGCDVTWTASDASVPLGVCPEQTAFEADPMTGAAVAAIDGRFAVATPDGLLTTDIAADMVAWDANIAAAYVAERGRDTLSAVSLDGEVLWTLDTGWPIAAVSPQGEIGRVTVMHEYEDGAGLLAMYAGTDGGLVGDAVTPSPADAVISSANGAVVGAVLTDKVHFFETDPRLR